MSGMFEALGGLKVAKIYALYKGDEYLDSGSLAALAARRGVQHRTLLWMLTPSYKKRLEAPVKHRKGGRLRLVSLEDCDGD